MIGDRDRDRGVSQGEAALRKELRMLKQLLDASDHERQIIAFEIHDGLAQQLAGAIMHLQTFGASRRPIRRGPRRRLTPALTMLRQGHLQARPDRRREAPGAG